MRAQNAWADVQSPTPFAAGFSELLALRGRLRELSAGDSPIRRASAALPGAHLSVMPGRGLEFAELREYRAGDDPRRIDWRHTARRGRPYTKVYQGERERPLWLLADVGPTMRFATRGVFKSVQAVRAAAVLAWAGIETGDRVGGGGFGFAGEAAPLLLPPAGREPGAAHLLRALAAASGADPAEASAATLSGILRRLGRQLRAGDELAILSDFAEPAVEGLLRPLSAQVALTLVQIADPLEVAPPPPGIYPIRDGAGERWVDLSDPALRAVWGEPFRERVAWLERLAARGDIWHVLLATDEDPLRLLQRRRVGTRRPALA